MFRCVAHRSAKQSLRSVDESQRNDAFGAVTESGEIGLKPLDRAHAVHTRCDAGHSLNDRRENRRRLER
jgi:hypothetical protein